MFMKAAENNCEAVLNACSSVGEVADCVQSAAAYLGMPIVRIDEEMCRDAARKGSRIGVMATLPTTLIPLPLLKCLSINSAVLLKAMQEM